MFMYHAMYRHHAMFIFFIQCRSCSFFMFMYHVPFMYPSIEFEKKNVMYACAAKAIVIQNKK